ncbi:hypothetical protein D3C78_1505620 [compost metagenome]
MLADREGDVVEHRQIGKQRAELEQHAHATAVLVQLALVHAANVAAVDQHLALLGADLAGDQSQQRGFAAAAAAHDGDQLATADFQRNVLQDEPVAIAEADAVEFDETVVLHDVVASPWGEQVRGSYSRSPPLCPAIVPAYAAWRKKAAP